jgi:hypothetical protein
MPAKPRKHLKTPKIKQMPLDASGLLKSEEMYAIQAVHAGQATPHQQQLCIKSIVKDLCGLLEMSFDPDNERMAAFNEGRRHVGRALANIADMSVTKLQKIEKQLLDPDEEEGTPDG